MEKFTLSPDFTEQSIVHFSDAYLKGEPVALEAKIADDNGARVGGGICAMVLGGLGCLGLYKGLRLVNVRKSVAAIVTGATGLLWTACIAAGISGLQDDVKRDRFLAEKAREVAQKHRTWVEDDQAESLANKWGPSIDHLKQSRKRSPEIPQGIFNRLLDDVKQIACHVDGWKKALQTASSDKRSEAAKKLLPVMMDHAYAMEGLGSQIEDHRSSPDPYILRAAQEKASFLALENLLRTGVAIKQNIDSVEKAHRILEMNLDAEQIS
jgi:hypothetical protein